jgi:hypothetical protein
MSRLTRRQLLAGFLGGLVHATGTVVLARSVLPAESDQDAVKGPQSEPQRSLAERADQVAADQEPPCDEEGFQTISFINGGFRNGGGGGGFRKGGFANGGGGFRNGGFANGGGGGGFRKGGFANGGGGFRNGGFANGGGGFRKGGFLN